MVGTETSSSLSGGREWTVSIALPGSILANAQSEVLRTYVAGCVARSVAVFNVDEVVVFNDGVASETEKFDSDAMLELMLQYLETPQYLRRHLFRMEHRLKHAGLLNPLDATHHLRQNEILRWREGVVVPQHFRRNDPQAPWGAQLENEGSSSNPKTSLFVDVGFREPVRLRNSRPIETGTRITVDFETENPKIPPARAIVAHRTDPRRVHGYYWGYTVRRAASLSSIFADSPFESGYDHVIGTSERGTSSVDDENFVVGPFSHLLIVFGGVKGLEVAASSDSNLVARGIGNELGIAKLFDQYVNTCPGQGSRTIRTEEAVSISLAALKPKLRFKSSSKEDASEKPFPQEHQKRRRTS